MSVKELLDWVLRAEKYHEEHCLAQTGNYEFRKECLVKTAPTHYAMAEFELAMVLVRDFWNDCQDWRASL